MEPEPEASAAYSIAAVDWFASEDETQWNDQLAADPLTAPLLRCIRAALGDE